MSFPLHARFAHPDAGYAGDQKTAAEHLTPGEVYTILRMDVGRSQSTLTFYETPSGVTFNTVMFEPDAGNQWDDDFATDDDEVQQ